MFVFVLLCVSYGEESLWLLLLSHNTILNWNDIIQYRSQNWRIWKAISQGIKRDDKGNWTISEIQKKCRGNPVLLVTFYTFRNTREMQRKSGLTSTFFKLSETEEKCRGNFYLKCVFTYFGWLQASYRIPKSVHAATWVLSNCTAQI